MPGRIDEIELVDLAGFGFEIERDARGFDGDAALALEIHRIEDLRLHLAGLESAALLNEAIGQGRFTVINMGNDREIADILHQVLQGLDNLRLYRAAVVFERLKDFFGVQPSVAHEFSRK